MIHHRRIRGTLPGVMSKVRRVLGLAIVVLSVASAVYGLFRLMQFGSCASGGNYVSNRQCPPDTWKWSLMLGGGIIVALLGLGLAFIKGFGPDPRMAEMEAAAKALAANRRQTPNFATVWPQIQAAQAAQAAQVAQAFQQAQPTQPAQQDPIARLERLAALRDSGALSPAEFDRLKAEILAES